MLALPLTQQPQLGPADRMGAWRAVLEAIDVERAGFEIDLVPAQGDKLGGPQPMAVGEQDQKGIASTVAPAPARRRNHALDFIGSQMLARSQFGVFAPASTPL